MGPPSSAATAAPPCTSSCQHPPQTREWRLSVKPHQKTTWLPPSSTLTSPQGRGSGPQHSSRAPPVPLVALPANSVAPPPTATRPGNAALLPSSCRLTLPQTQPPLSRAISLETVVARPLLQLEPPSSSVSAPPLPSSLCLTTLQSLILPPLPLPLPQVSPARPHPTTCDERPNERRYKPATM